MTLGERIKKVRRSIDLTQSEFCQRIGLKRNSISLVESGKRNISDQAILAICREFGVREEWLRTGEGEMFAPAASNTLDALARQYGLSHDMYIMIEKLICLNPKIQQGVVDYILEVAAALSADDVPRGMTAFPGETVKNPHDMSLEEMQEAVARQYADERQAGEESGGSGFGNSGTATG